MTGRNASARVAGIKTPRLPAAFRRGVGCRMKLSSEKTPPLDAHAGRHPQSPRRQVLRNCWWQAPLRSTRRATAPVDFRRRTRRRDRQGHRGSAWRRRTRRGYCRTHRSLDLRHHDGGASAHCGRWSRRDFPGRRHPRGCHQETSILRVFRSGCAGRTFSWFCQHCFPLPRRTCPGIAAIWRHTINHCGVDAAPKHAAGSLIACRPIARRLTSIRLCTNHLEACHLEACHLEACHRTALPCHAAPPCAA
jgi:hypothetical protein